MFIKFSSKIINKYLILNQHHFCKNVIESLVIDIGKSKDDISSPIEIHERVLLEPTREKSKKEKHALMIFSHCFWMHLLTWSF
jgi:hypothetical protein